jgi:hypothetical protein
VALMRRTTRIDCACNSDRLAMGGHFKLFLIDGELTKLPVSTDSVLHAADME